MKTIRKSLFETNSSSVHCVAISKDSVDCNKFPKEIKLVDELSFDWGTGESYHDPDSKFTYIIIPIRDAVQFKDDDFIQRAMEYYTKIITTLNNNNVKTPDNMLKCAKNSYIDHSYCVFSEILPSLAEDEDRLLRFLFNNDSYIETGNDNDSDDYPSPPENYESFYKYN